MKTLRILFSVVIFAYGGFIGYLISFCVLFIAVAFHATIYVFFGQPVPYRIESAVGSSWWAWIFYAYAILASGIFSVQELVFKDKL